MHYIPVFLFVVLMVWSNLFRFTPLLIPLFYVIFSLITFMAYAKDKRAARLEQWRVSEGMLHFLALAGGWPGAIVAQQLFRHKTRKTEFRIIFWMTLLANTLAFIWLHYPDGASSLQAVMAQLERIVMIEVQTPELRQALLKLLQY